MICMHTADSNSPNPYREELAWLQSDALLELQALKREVVRAGRELFDLSMINPDLPPPRVMIDKLVEASLKPFNHRYAVSRGIPRLREAFAHKYANRFSTQLDSESEICVTMGTKDAVLDSMVSLARPGESVLLGAPTYPAHLSAARLAGLRADVFAISTDESAMLGSIAAKLQERPFKLIVLNFPNNPTGLSVSQTFYSELLQLTERHGTFVLNDFVYGEMGFSEGVPSLLSACQTRRGCAEVYSLSKAYSVPGWRVAALSGSQRLVHQVTRLKAHVDYGIFLPIQAAAAFALSAKEDLVKPLTSQYNNRCRTLATGLRRLGWEVAAPTAGACVWGKMPHKLQAGGSRAFALDLLRESGILAMPGILFGTEFDRYIRFAVVLSEERIRQMLENLATWS